LLYFIRYFKSLEFIELMLSNLYLLLKLAVSALYLGQLLLKS